MPARSCDPSSTTNRAGRSCCRWPAWGTCAGCRQDLGDPGTVNDASVARSDLPPYRGPGEPASGHVHEWGETEADDLDLPPG